ncbi:response regulator [Halalkalibacter oceani]|uniref:response regulator n=1 Tax=Halalkalibacter oceani TaxID=1653776 RepID=UPI0033949833
MLNVIIIDDEIHAIKLVEHYLNEIPQVYVSARFQDPMQVFTINDLSKIDVIFLDIEMPEVNGFEFAKKISERNEKIKIVFVTAFTQYAVGAFELDTVVDYLVKPITKERLLKTMNRLIKHDETHSPELYISCCGSFEVYYKGEPLAWKTYKVKELFAYLLHQHAPVDRLKIFDDLWPELPDEKAKVNFHTCISLLRKAFREIGYDHVIKRTGSQYQFTLTAYQSDIQTIEQALVELQQEPAGNSEKNYKTIFSLYKGAYLEQEDYHWSFHKREELQQSVHTCLLTRASQFLKSGRLDQAAVYFQKMIEVNPTVEETYYQLMNVYRQLDKKIEALKLYSRLEATLEEFGLEPSLNSKKIYREITNKNV